MKVVVFLRERKRGAGHTETHVSVVSGTSRMCNRPSGIASAVWVGLRCPGQTLPPAREKGTFILPCARAINTENLVGWLFSDWASTT
jgi:hypothetical protein